MGYEITDPNTGLPVLVKKVADSRNYKIYFTDLLVGAEIASVASVVSTNQNIKAGSSNLTAGASSGTQDYVSVQLSGGTDGENYRITATVADTAGNTLVGEGMLFVRNT